MDSMGFWYLIYKNLSCTIDNSILISKSNLKRGKTISVDRMSYRAAIVNPTATLPRFFCKKKANPLTTIYVFQSYLCLQTDIYNQTLHVCLTVCARCYSHFCNWVHNISKTVPLRTPLPKWCVHIPWSCLFVCSHGNNSCFWL